MLKQNKNPKPQKTGNKQFSEILTHNLKQVSKIYTCSGVILIWIMKHMKNIEGTDT